MLMDNDEAFSGSPDIATPDEVLATFTQLMRGEKSSEQLKAAEQLAKYHSLFTPKEETGCKPELIAEIEEAVAQITAAVQPAPHDAASPAETRARPSRRCRKSSAAASGSSGTNTADGTCSA